MGCISSLEAPHFLRQNPTTLHGEDVLLGFVLNLKNKLLHRCG